MQRVNRWLCGVAVSVCWCAAGGALAQGAAAGSCESEASWAPSGTARYFLVLAASRSGFYDASGPSFVMLAKTGAPTEQTEMGALGIHADSKGRPVFGSVPWPTYDAFLREPGKGSENILLRLEINGPQYERVHDVMRVWERRARENALLYPDDLFLNNILLVKQATEELNRCRPTVNLYKVDWGIEDRISDTNAPSRVPFLVFEELRRRNVALHVPDSKMPEGLLATVGSPPLPADETVAATHAVVRPPATAHVHHIHKSPEPAL